MSKGRKKVQQCVRPAVLARKTAQESAGQINGSNLPLNRPTGSDTDLKAVYDFTVDIVDKQYRSYTWSDGKFQALITIDAALIAGILLILQTYKPMPLFPEAVLAGSFLALVVSFVTSLVHAIPRIHSGIGNHENLRTMVCISNLTKESYHQKMTQLQLKDMVAMNCWQIAGMCKNNMRSHSLLRFGVLLTIFGLISITVALPMLVWPGQATHDKGSPPQTATQDAPRVLPLKTVAPANSAPSVSPPRALSPNNSTPNTNTSTIHTPNSDSH